MNVNLRKQKPAPLPMTREPDPEFWYRPWSYVHASHAPRLRRFGLDETDELAQRVRYPVWCDLFSLPRHPEELDSSAWWAVAAAPRDAFERASALVGLILVAARNRRDTLTLVRSPEAVEAAENGDLRWAMQKAQFSPRSVIEMQGWESISDPVTNAYLSLHFSVACATPCLLERIRLRYDQQMVQACDFRAPLQCRDPQDQAQCVGYIAKLWIGALARAGISVTGTDAAEAQAAVHSSSKEDYE